MKKLNLKFFFSSISILTASCLLAINIMLIQNPILMIVAWIFMLFWLNISSILFYKSIYSEKEYIKFLFSFVFTVIFTVIGVIIWERIAYFIG